MRVSGKLALRVAAIGVTVGAIALPASAYAAAPASAPHGTTATPSITVVPDTGVKNNSTVKVSGTGFPVSQPAVYVVECSGTSGAAQCDLSTVNFNTGTDSSGSFSNVPVKVHTGTVGSGTCNAGGKCFIAASTSTSPTPDPSQSATATFTFAGHAAVKTTTKAKFVKRTHKVTGKVKSAGKGVKGLKTKLEIRKHGHWKAVATLKTHKGGAFSSKKLHKSGTYEVKTPKQKKYGASHSKKIKVTA